MVIAEGSRALKLGFEAEMVVQEWGWDEDVDDTLRVEIEDVIGTEMLDEDSSDVVDIVVLWWRDDDGDLTDALMDAVVPLTDEGFIWVLSPKTGSVGHVVPAEISEAALTVGLTQTSVVNLGHWTGSRLVQPKSPATKR